MLEGLHLGVDHQVCSETSVADPYYFDVYSDSDPACHLNADPDPACHFEGDRVLPFTLMQIRILASK